MHNLPSSLNNPPQGFQTVHNVYICLLNYTKVVTQIFLDSLVFWDRRVPDG